MVNKTEKKINVQKWKNDTLDSLEMWLLQTVVIFETKIFALTVKATASSLSLINSSSLSSFSKADTSPTSATCWKDWKNELEIYCLVYLFCADNLGENDDDIEI